MNLFLEPADRQPTTVYSGDHRTVNTLIISEVVMGIRPMFDLSAAFTFGDMVEGHAYWQGVVLDDNLDDVTIGKLSLLLEEVDVANA